MCVLDTWPCNNIVIACIAMAPSLKRSSDQLDFKLWRTLYCTNSNAIYIWSHSTIGLLQSISPWSWYPLKTSLLVSSSEFCLDLLLIQYLTNSTNLQIVRRQCCLHFLNKKNPFVIPFWIVSWLTGKMGVCWWYLVVTRWILVVANDENWIFWQFWMLSKLLYSKYPTLSILGNSICPLESKSET